MGGPDPTGGDEVLSDQDSLGDLPDDSMELYQLATAVSTFPYEREAAIEKLAILEDADVEPLLASLAAGDALTLDEQEQAAAKLDEQDR